MPIEAYESRALLALAIETLREELLPALPADRRYAGAMVANALEIAARDLESDLGDNEQSLGGAIGDKYAGDMALLARHIRHGKITVPDSTLLPMLQVHLERELAVRNPRFLQSRK